MALIDLIPDYSAKPGQNEGGLEETMGWFGFGKNKEKEVFDPSRRKFLRDITVTAAAIGLGGTGALTPSEAKAGVSYTGDSGENQKVKPKDLLIKEEAFFRTPLGKELMGIRGNHTATKEAMYQMTAIQFYEKVTGISVNGYPLGVLNSPYSSVLKEAWDARKDRSELLKFVGVEAFENGTSPVTLEMLKNEPAVYLLAAFLYDNCDIIAKEYARLSSNDPITQFAKGISGYTSAYICGLKNLLRDESLINLKDNVELPFLSSIFSAAGYNSGMEDYFRGDKEETLTKTFKYLQGREKKNKIIASWASTWLTNHYDLQKQKSNADIIHLKLERPLAQISSRIRGKSGVFAYYYDDKGDFKV